MIKTKKVPGGIPLLLSCVEPFGAGIKCQVQCTEDQNLNESCIRKALKCHDLYLMLGI